MEEDIEHRLKSFIKELKIDTVISFRIAPESREALANDLEHLLQAYKEEIKANTNLSMLNVELSFKAGKYEEKIKEDEKEKFLWEHSSIRADKFLQEIEKNICGRSITFPEGWLRPTDIVNIIEFMLKGEK